MAIYTSSPIRVYIGDMQSYEKTITRLEGMLSTAIRIGELRGDEALRLAIERAELLTAIQRALHQLRTGRADEAFKILQRFEHDD